MATSGSPNIAETYIFDRIMSHVTITDPRHFLFGHRLAVLGDRSGRGPAYVVVELADGRKRSVRIAATDLVPRGNSSRAAGPDPPRISVRTLIPLAQHLNRILTLLTEEVIRDEPQTLQRRRVASPPSIPTIKINRLSVAPPHLWPNLSAETQTQIARILAELLRRMLPRHVRLEGRSPVLIAANAADERLTTAHRAKLAYVYVRQSSLNQVRQHQESTRAAISAGRSRHCSWVAPRARASH